MTVRGPQQTRLIKDLHFDVNPANGRQVGAVRKKALARNASASKRNTGNDKSNCWMKRRHGGRRRRSVNTPKRV